DVIDTAPHDTHAILDIAKDVSRAVDEKDYPTARALLSALTSEIRVRTYNLPLATYQDALQDAARLLDKKSNNDASSVLLTALNTLVVVDRVTPLPLVLAREAINQAQEKSRQDKNSAQNLLKVAKNEVERARELGYTGKDKEYADLNNQISSLEKQLRGNQDASAAFSKLKEKMSAFLKRQSEQKRG
ncbi:MAG: YfdX family protein, partial [Terriglobales bacterium]